MRAQVHGMDGKKTGEMELGKAFSNKVRVDLVLRAFLAEQSARRQAYGTDPMAGKRTSAHYHGERGRRWAMMNREMARGKRIHNQGNLNYTGRFTPHAIKGRAAHPPKAEKIWEVKINKKEKIKAMFAALSATTDKSLVSQRGHLVNGSPVPYVFEDKLEELKNTKKLVDLLRSIGLGNELERAKEKTVRAGKGKVRGRKYKKKKSLLIVVKDDKGLGKAARNMAGVDVSST
ncbi:MAG TPA: 50S ribosomal protein L4, partial [archaeon]|nr:50S ribosomal protein L4 [archaeon]